MTARTSRLVLLPALACLLATFACSRPGQPVAPTVAGGTADQTTSAAPVGLTGVVRGLDAPSRAFTLVARPASRLVRADDTTEVWIGGARARFGALRDGMTVGVRGIDQGRYVQARTIAVTR